MTVRTLAVRSGRYSRQWWRETARLYDSDVRDRFDIVLSVSAGARSMVRRRARRGSRPYFFLQAHGTAWAEVKSKLRLFTPIALLKAMMDVGAMWRDRAYRLFDGVIAVGEKVARDLAALPTRLIVEGLPVTTIVNGIDERVFAFDAAARRRIRQQHGIGAGDRLVLSASRLHPQKGVLEGLEGFASAAGLDDRLRMLIVGDGPGRADVARRIAALGLGARVILIGGVERGDMPAHLSAADAFLFPTRRHEGLPLNLMEALANGLPLVLSPEAGSGWPESFVAAASDAEAMGANIVQAVDRRGERSLLPGRFSLDTCARAYLDLFAAWLAQDRAT